MPNRDPQDLERFVHRALRELPARRAPAALEDRVFAALAARQRAPWWQRGWQAWPLVPRTLVLGAGTAAAVAVIWLAMAGTQAMGNVSLDALVQSHAPWLLSVRSVLGTLGDALRALFAHYQVYFVGALAVLAAAYFTTIGVGASLYRSFALDR